VASDFQVPKREKEGSYEDEKTKGILTESRMKKAENFFRKAGKKRQDEPSTVPLTCLRKPVRIIESLSIER